MTRSTNTAFLTNIGEKQQPLDLGIVQYVQVMDKVIIARTLLHVIRELHAEYISKHYHELPGASGRCKNI